MIKIEVETSHQMVKVLCYDQLQYVLSSRFANFFSFSLILQ